LATPNYGYEKRQKELAKKRKKEDKLKAKSERKLGENGEELEPEGAQDGAEEGGNMSQVQPHADPAAQSASLEPPAAT
jgi:hypothetical protein